MTLGKFLDELIRRAAAKPYAQSAFIRMRRDHGSVESIRRLVETSTIQSVFGRLAALGLIEWSLESAVLRFPDRFSAKTVLFARARLQGLANG